MTVHRIIQLSAIISGMHSIAAEIDGDFSASVQKVSGSDTKGRNLDECSFPIGSIDLCDMLPNDLDECVDSTLALKDEVRIGNIALIGSFVGVSDCVQGDDLICSVDLDPGFFQNPVGYGLVAAFKNLCEDEGGELYKADFSLSCPNGIEALAITDEINIELNDVNMCLGSHSACENAVSFLDESFETISAAGDYLGIDCTLEAVDKSNGSSQISAGSIIQGQMLDSFVDDVCVESQLEVLKDDNLKNAAQDLYSEVLQDFAGCLEEVNDPSSCSIDFSSEEYSDLYSALDESCQDLDAKIEKLGFESSCDEGSFSFKNAPFCVSNDCSINDDIVSDINAVIDLLLEIMNNIEDLKDLLQPLFVIPNIEDMVDDIIDQIDDMALNNCSAEVSLNDEGGCSSIQGKKSCNQENGCSFQKSKGEPGSCKDSLSAEECSEKDGKKLACKNRGCVWKNATKLCKARW